MIDRCLIGHLHHRQTEEDHERDEATTGEQERDGTAEGQPNAPPRRKPRIRTITKWPDDKEVVTELTPEGFPKERKAKLRMKRLASLIARQRISLLTPSISTLSNEQKIKIFEECVQPSLDFAEALKAIATKWIWKVIA